jgi:hypothetical protein
MRIYLGLLLCLTNVLQFISSANAASVTLNWTATGDDGLSGVATVYDIRYSLSTITDANWASATKVTGLPAPRVSGSAETFTVTGLTDNTVYYFAMKVGDEAANWSALSNVIQKLTSQEAIAPAAVANLSAGTATSTSVALAWTAPGDDGNVGTASQYDIRYSTATITSANFSSATKTASAPTPRIAGSAESFMVSGLSAGTTYYFAVKTADEVPNWSGISNVVSRATLIAVPSPPTLASPASGATGISTSPTLSWNSTATATSYRVQVSTDAAFATTVVNQSNVTATTLAVTGLSANTTFYWHVSASNSSGTSAYSSTRSFATLTNGPEPPPRPTLTAPTEERLIVYDMLPTFSWSEVIDPNPLDEVKYRMELSLDPSFTLVVSFDGLTEPTYQMADSLSFNTHYWWRVTAFDPGGLFSVSDTADFWSWTLGDVNHNHDCTLADVMFLVDYLFISETPIVPRKAGDVTSDCDITLGDVMRMVDHLFVSKAELKAGCE